MPDPRIRRVTPEDVDDVVELVHQLAEYERAPEECHLTPDQLHRALFGPAPALYGHVAEVPAPAAGRRSEVAGFTLWFLNFSTWRGVHGIYLEDLYVRPAHRGSGLGKALLAALAEECLHHGYERLEWWVLNWNEQAIGVYEALGAVPMDEWTVYRLTGGPLRELGSATSPSEPADRVG